MNRFASEVDLRTLLARKGLRIVDVERQAGMARGSFQRILAGRRGQGVRFETVLALAGAMGVSVEVFAAALKRTRDDAAERARRIKAVELACLRAELR